MTNHATVYDIQERLATPAHASVDRVCARLLDRAATPRTDHPDTHLGGTMATVVDRYVDAVVQEVIHRALVDGVLRFGRPLQITLWRHWMESGSGRSRRRFSVN